MENKNSLIVKTANAFVWLKNVLGNKYSEFIALLKKNPNKAVKVLEKEVEKSYTVSNENKAKLKEEVKRNRLVKATGIGALVLSVCILFSSCYRIDWNERGTNGDFVHESQTTVGGGGTSTDLPTPGTIDTERPSDTSGTTITPSTGTVAPSTDTTTTPSSDTATTAPITMAPAPTPVLPGGNSVSQETDVNPSVTTTPGTVAPSTPTITPLDVSTCFPQILPNLRSSMDAYYNSKKISSTGRVGGLDIKSISLNGSKIQIIATGKLTSKQGNVTKVVTFITLPASENFVNAYTDIVNNGSHQGNLPTFVSACNDCLASAVGKTETMSVENGYIVDVDKTKLNLSAGQDAVVCFKSLVANKGEYTYLVVEYNPTSCDIQSRTVTSSSRLTVNECRALIAEDVNGVESTLAP